MEGRAEQERDAEAPVISLVLLRPQTAEQLTAANDDPIGDEELLVADTGGKERILEVLAASQTGSEAILSSPGHIPASPSESCRPQSVGRKEKKRKSRQRDRRRSSNSKFSPRVSRTLQKIPSFGFAGCYGNAHVGVCRIRN